MQGKKKKEDPCLPGKPAWQGQSQGARAVKRMPLDMRFDGSVQQLLLTGQPLDPKVLEMESTGATLRIHHLQWTSAYASEVDDRLESFTPSQMLKRSCTLGTLGGIMGTNHVIGGGLRTCFPFSN